MKAVTANRNDPCPCGSGKKFKKCCATRKKTTVAPSRRSQVPIYVLALVLVGAALAGMRVVMRAPETPPPTFSPPSPAAQRPTAPATSGVGMQPDPVTGLYPHPPGPAPEGRVWSPEHGHWHNLPSMAPQQVARQVETPAASPFTSRPIPPYNRRVARQLEQSLMTYNLPISADLQAVLPPPAF